MKAESNIYDLSAERMKELPDQSADLILTSPPADIRRRFSLTPRTIPDKILERIE